MRALNYAVILLSAACVLIGLGCGPIDEAQELQPNVDASLEELKAEDAAETPTTRTPTQVTQQRDAWPDFSKIQNQTNYRTQQAQWPTRNFANQQQSWPNQNLANRNLATHQQTWPTDNVADAQPVADANIAEPAVGAVAEPAVGAVGAVGAVVAEPAVAPVAAAIVDPAPAVVQPVVPYPYARSGFAAGFYPFNYGGLYDVSIYKRPLCGCPPEPVYIPNNPCTAYCTDVRCYDLGLFGLNWQYQPLFRGLPYAIY